MLPEGVKGASGSESHSDYSIPAHPGKAEPRAGDSERVFTGDPNVSQLHRAPSMTSAETAGGPNGGAFAAMFNPGSGGFSTPHKATAGQRRRPAREASGGQGAAAGCPYSPSARQAPRRPSTGAAPEMLFSAGVADASASAAQRPIFRSSAAAATAAGFGAPSGAEHGSRPDVQGPGMSQGAAGAAHPAAGRRTSFMFSSPPPLAARQAPATPPPRAGHEPSLGRAPGFSFSALPTADQAPGAAAVPQGSPPAAKRRSPTEAPGRGAAPGVGSSAGWPPAATGFSEPLLSRQFAGVQLDRPAAGLPSADRQTLASKLQQASIGVPVAEAMAARFAESVTLGAGAPAGAGPQTAGGAASSGADQEAAMTPERPRDSGFGAAATGGAEAKTPSMFTPAISMFTPGNTPVTGTARRGARKADPPSRRPFGGAAGGTARSFTEFGQGGGGFSFSTPAPSAAQASGPGTPMDFSPMDCSPYPRPASVQPEGLKPYPSDATGSEPPAQPAAQLKTPSAAAAAAGSQAPLGSSGPAGEGAAPAANGAGGGAGPVDGAAASATRPAGAPTVHSDAPSGQQSAAQAEPAPSFSADFVAKLSVSDAGSGRAAGFAFGAAPRQPSTAQGTAYKMRSARAAAGSARAKPAAAAPQPAAAASSQEFQQQPAPSAQPPAFGGFPAGGVAPPSSFDFGGPAATFTPASGAAPGQPAPMRAAGPAPADFSFSFGTAMPAGAAAAAAAAPTAQMRTPRRAVHVRSRTSPMRAARGGGSPTVPPHRSNLFQQPGAGSPAAHPAKASSFNPRAGKAHGVPEASAAWPPSQVPRPPAAAAARGRHAKAVQLEEVDQRAKGAFRTRSYSQAELGYSKAVELARDLGDRAELVKQLNNRAAARLMLQRTQDALSDCEAALQMDPGNARAAVRASNCHARLGEYAAAVAVLEAAAEARPCAEIRAQLKEVASLQAAFAQTESKALTGGPEAVEQALVQLTQLMEQQGPSARLLLLVVHGLLRLRRGADAVSLLAQQQQQEQVVHHWAWWPSVQLAWQQGNHQQAAEVLRRSYVATSAAVPGALRVPTEEELEPVLVQLARVDALKQRGNELLKSGSHSAACEQYTAALAACVGGGGPVAPPPVVAVLHCNRAAAHQALGQLPEAIADCSRARALNANYVKAHSRMAALLTEVGRPDAAATALEDMGKLPMLTPSERRDQATRLRTAISACSGKAPTANHYKLMGLPNTCNQDEVRKTYKKMALRFHPDKALANCRFAERLGAHGAPLAEARSIEDRIRSEADWLFKCIGEAHSVLSDMALRGELDSELARKSAAASRKAYQSPSTHWSWRASTGTPPAAARSASFSGRASGSAYGGAPGNAYPHRASDGYSGNSTFGARRGGAAAPQRPAGPRPAPPAGSRSYGAQYAAESDESSEDEWEKSFWSEY